MAYVLYEKKDHVVFITLNRPDRMNALGRELMAELTEAEAQFAEDNDAWVAVYTGAGDRAFSVGRDMKEAADPGSGGGDLTKFFEKGFFTSEKPTIAAVNGFAMGGGCEKALSCDVRICSTNAVFAFPEVSVGLCPPVGSFLLPRLIGLSNALWLLMSGERIDAQEALRVGLVTRVVAADELLPTATKMAEAIARNSPLGVRATKKLATLGLELPMDYARSMGASLISSVWTSQDAIEGIMAFAEKRQPEWKLK